MIYTGQVVQIVLETNVDLSGATSPRIRYMKQDKTTGEWVASINGNDLEYTTTNSDLDIKGDWKLQAYFNQNGDRYGNIARMQVDNRI